MFAPAVLLGLVGVTARAVLGRDDCGYGDLVFLGTVFLVRTLVLFVVLLANVRVECLGLVAVEAGNVGTCVSAVAPVGKYPWTFHLVTPNTSYSLFWHAALYPEFLCLRQVFARLSIGNSGA